MLKKTFISLTLISAAFFSNSSFSFESDNLIISAKSWKNLDVTTYKFPHVFVINQKNNSIYYHVGGNNEDFEKLLLSRERAEDLDDSISSLQELKSLPEVSKLLESNYDKEIVLIISPDKSVFDCSACNTQKGTLDSYVSKKGSKLISIYIK